VSIFFRTRPRGACMALDGRAALLLVVALAAVRAQTDCYNVTHPSLEAHFDAGSALVRACRAAGDTGPNATTCHDPCVQALVTERQGECFVRLQLLGHTCEDLLGLIMSVLTMQKAGITGCRPRVDTICRQKPKGWSLPWHAIVPAAAGGFLLAAAAVSAAWYFVDRLQLHQYEKSDDENLQARPPRREADVFEVQRIEPTA
jgi:hypothetical protein